MVASATEASRVSTQVTEILRLVSTFQDTAGSIQSISDSVKTLALGSQGEYLKITSSDLVLKVRLAEAKEQQILDWLSSRQSSYKHHAICSTRIPGTGQWLLDCGRFKSWVDNANPILWCTGGPGVGKTVLA